MTGHEPLRGVFLFSGVGGIELAAQRAGVVPVASVEIDKAARGVLARRFPDTRLYEDVSRVHAANVCPSSHLGDGADADRERVSESRRERRADGGTGTAGSCPDCLPAGRVDLVAGGFPCQDLSVAGRRAGLAGLRSGLFYELARIVSETAPRWVLLENVPGLLSSNDGRDMAAVVGTLGDLGYGWAYRVLDAQFLGVPQRRRRVFVVGCLGDRAAPVEILLEPKGGGGDHPTGQQTGQGIAASLTAGTSASRGVSRPGRRQEDDVNLVVSALTANMAGGGGGADDNTAQGGHLIAATLRTREGHGCERGDGQDNLITHALPSEGADASADGTGRGTPLVAFAWQAGGNNSASGAFNDDGTTPTLPKSQTLAIAEAAQAVRRLTPMECERLQGFPDGWTDGQADAARYRQMGNAVAVPVVEWIVRRLVAADAQIASESEAVA